MSRDPDEGDTHPTSLPEALPDDVAVLKDIKFAKNKP